jgi:hypothetical protein
MNPADSAVAPNVKVAPVKAGFKDYLLTDCVPIDTVDLEAESCKTHIMGLALEGMDVTYCPYTLTADRKF